MAYVPTYAEAAPSQEEIDTLPGLALIEFGANWCGHCQGAQPAIVAAMASYPMLRHIKVEDGPGRRLGRSYRVKLWPTLIFLRDGQESERLVRPTSEAEIAAALARLVSS
ncbi:MAG: thioredoxin family protein [Betaproteobacteria bacterium]|nr:thioredoxin family protein [Betaproteobacteria bacterium]